MEKRPLKVALFGSFYRGFYVLSELIELSRVLNGVEIVGVATDDPSASYTSPSKRVWQYPHTQYETRMVEELALQHSLEVFKGRVKSDAFYEIFENNWKPDVCYMATFGQLINERLFSFPKLGFYNLHPSSDKNWPSFVGGNPFQAMLDAGEDYAVITLHAVDEKFDHGQLIDVSDRVYFPKETTVVELHKTTSIIAGKLVKHHLSRLHRIWV